MQNSKEGNNETDAVDDDGDQPTGTDIDILNSLTGLPQTEDELLYVIPVVAPYSTLMPYKYYVFTLYFSFYSVTRNFAEKGSKLKSFPDRPREEKHQKQQCLSF